MIKIINLLFNPIQQGRGDRSKWDAVLTGPGDNVPITPVAHYNPAQLVATPVSNDWFS